MFALLKKDLYTLKRTYLLYVGMLLFYLFFDMVSGNEGNFFLAFFAVFTMMLPATSMTLDEQAGWDGYGMCLPIRRRTVVLSKYAFHTIAMFAGYGIIVLAATIYHFVQTGEFGLEILMMPVIFGCGGLLVSDLLLPLMFKLGAEKGRYVLVGVVWGLALVPVMLVKLIGVDLYAFAEGAAAGLDTGMLLVLIVAATVFLTVASAAVSIAIYNRKELK
ncbi:ABC-2 transporter permease [Butyricicoccus sp. 1XD8-22]|nr:ABC-2 transporter permease [Butyricicoccus sp. 1XD8-22]